MSPPWRCLQTSRLRCHSLPHHRELESSIAFGSKALQRSLGADRTRRGSTPEVHAVAKPSCLFDIPLGCPGGRKSRITPLCCMLLTLNNNESPSFGDTQNPIDSMNPTRILQTSPDLHRTPITEPKLVLASSFLCTHALCREPLLRLTMSYVPRNISFASGVRDHFPDGFRDSDKPFRTQHSFRWRPPKRSDPQIPHRPFWSKCQFWGVACRRTPHVSCSIRCSTSCEGRDRRQFFLHARLTCVGSLREICFSFAKRSFLSS